MSKSSIFHVLNRCKLLAALSLFPISATAQRGLTEIPNPDPEAQLAAFTVPEGLEINLFASDPQISKPIQMNWDSAGRLWVVCSPLYPQIKPGQAAGDQVVVLEDVDGDGVAEKSTVFATALEIPTAILPVEGGAYVANSTEVIFLEDHDGDLVSESRKIILSGFGTEDTHHLLHTFRRGPGGLIYFNQSIYIHSHIETPYGVKRLMGGGIWHFRPEDRHLGILSKGLVNPWGFEFDRWGQSFATDGAGSQGINFIFLGSVFLTSPGAPRVLSGLNPGQPKHCGLEIASGSALPESWDGQLITCDFRGNRLNRFSLEDSGSTYISTQQSDPLASTHGAFRPIDVRLGPDGALYIADWYNPIIQHGEVDFRDPRRDHQHGRIWRLKAKENPVLPRVDFAQATIPELLKLLRSDFSPHRQFAKETLVLRDHEEVSSALETWITNDNDRLEALWVQMAMRRPAPANLVALSNSSDPRHRSAALRVLNHTSDLYPAEQITKILTRAIADPAPRVRLWAISCLATQGSAEDLSLALQALDAEIDDPIDFALEQFARDTAESWLTFYQSGDLTLGTKPEHAVYALRASGGASAAASLLSMLQENSLADPAGAAEIVAKHGDAKQRATLLALAKGDHQKPYLSALLAGAQGDPTPPEGDLALIPELIVGSDLESAALATQLAGYWKQPETQPALEAALQKPELVLPAAEALGRIGGDASVKLLTTAAESDARSVRSAAVKGLTLMGADQGAAATAIVLQRVNNPSEVADLIAPLLKKKRGIPALTKAISGTSLSSEIALAAIKSANTSGVNVTKLTDALVKAGAIRQMTHALTPEATADLAEQVLTKGDPHLGEAIYRRAELNCVVCHAIGETGGLIGPNLVSMGASAPIDYLIDSLLDPSAKIKEGYHTTLINTADGGVFTGGLVSEGDSETLLRDAVGGIITIPSATITKKEVSPISLMPPGLTASLREDEFLHLVRFLSELGKEGDFKTTPTRLVRHFRKLSQLTAEQADNIGHWGGASLANPQRALPWQPIVAYVDGRLPMSEIPIVKARRLNKGFLQCCLEVTGAGIVHLGLNDTTGLRFFDSSGEILSEDGIVTLDLEAGIHYLSLQVDPAARKETALSIELLTVSQGGAVVKAVTPQ